MIIIFRIHQRKVFSQHDIFNDQLSSVLHLLTVAILHTHTHCPLTAGDSLPAELSPNLRRVFTPLHHSNTLQPNSGNCNGNHNGQLVVVLIQAVLAKFTLQRFCTGCSHRVYLDDRITKIWLWNWNVLTTRSKIHENISGQKPEHKHPFCLICLDYDDICRIWKLPSNGRENSEFQNDLWTCIAKLIWQRRGSCYSMRAMFRI